MAKKYKFVDLFAGIGGMRIALENAGGRCVLTSEIDEMAMMTYKLNAIANASDHCYAGDITKISDDEIPAHDILVAGFPCQPYSLAGLRRGLSDARGQLFMDILRFIRIGKPKAFLLENVKGLVGHDKGKTFEFMVQSLKEQGDYVIHWAILNSMTHGNVPQNRERVFIVGIRKDQKNAEHFEFPKPEQRTTTFRELLEPLSDVPSSCVYTNRFKCYAEINSAVKSEETVYQWRRQYVRENKSGVCPTLTANMGGGGHNVPLVRQGDVVRRLTPRECARLQGFPDSFLLPGVAPSHLYKQFGNSVTVPLIEKIAKSIVKHIN